MTAPDDDSPRNAATILSGSSGDPLLDLLVPLLPADQHASVLQHKSAALQCVSKLRASSLDTIMDTSLNDQLAAEADAVSLRLSNLTLKSYPQLLKSADAVDSLLGQFAAFEETASAFYESQFSYIDQEMHHYLGLSTSADGEKLGGYSQLSAAGPAEKKPRRRSVSTHDPIPKPDDPEPTTPAKNAEDAVIVLKNLDKIQDILELPNLVLACVNNGYYAEALDLASHCARLSKRYSGVQVVQDIQRQVDDALKTMTVQLLQLLRESVKLPTLIKVVSYLRRMPPFNSRIQQQQQQQQEQSKDGRSASSSQSDIVTRQLQQLFLFSRLQYIRSMLSSLEALKKQSPDAYLKRYVEVFRENVFVTAVGFQSVFPDNEASSHGDRGPRQSEGSLLVASFIKSLVADFYTTVMEISPFIDDDNARASLWLQISYCSKSLGRVGADFWPTMQGPEERSGAQGTLSKEEWIAAIQTQLDISRHYGGKVAV